LIGHEESRRLSLAWKLMRESAGYRISTGFAPVEKYLRMANDDKDPMVAIIASVSTSLKTSYPLLWTGKSQ